MQSSNPIFPEGYGKVIHSLTAGLEQTTRESSDLEPRELSRGLGLFDSIMVVVGAMYWFGYLHCSGGDGPSDWEEQAGCSWPGAWPAFSRSPERCATESSRQ
jgi:hypothetical protein